MLPGFDPEKEISYPNCVKGVVPGKVKIAKKVEFFYPFFHFLAPEGKIGIDKGIHVYQTYPYVHIVTKFRFSKSHRNGIGILGIFLAFFWVLSYIMKSSQKNGRNFAEI